MLKPNKTTETIHLHFNFGVFLLQLAYVAAFTVSSYANTDRRTGKPFNPLLGETYECDRTDDYGWKSVAEQVGLVIIMSQSASIT